MGRSQETFSKKEKEKQKIARKKEKVEKAEERKANSDKGKSLDEMLVYLDENGNFTNTPPDPKKMRREIELEEIQMGAAKIEVDNNPVRIGTITFFNEAKGYGFIKDNKSGDSIFVHVHALIDPIKEGNKVTFGIEKGPKGLNATEVKLAP